jgi:hypothetical protein
MGVIAAARARSEAVIAACRRVPRATLLARAVLAYVGPLPEFGRVAPGERAVLEEACRSADAIDDGLKARLCARLAGDIIAANETEQAERVLALCDVAAAAARRAGDEGALAMALLGAHYAAALRMRPRSGDADSRDRRIPKVDDILRAAEAGGEHEIVAGIRHLRAAGLFAIGEADAFSAEVDGLATAAAASRAPDALCLADDLAAMRAVVEGRFREGRELMERAFATGRRMRLANSAGRHAAHRIMWHLAQGRLAEIVSEIDAFVAEHPGGTGWEPIRALARLASGDVAAARAEYHTLLAAGFDPADSGVMSRCYLAGLALLCVELGDRENAPALHDRVARQKEVWSVDGCHTFGPWPLLLGALARLCKRPADAARHFEKAIVVSRRMRARPFIAEAQASLAEVRATADPRAADDPAVAAMLDEASRTADELGLVHVAARVERVRAAIAERRGTGPSGFRCEGDVWCVSFRGGELRLRDGKGPRYLATLLASPGREVHVLELAAGAQATGVIATAPEDLTVGGTGGALEDAPDARASREYRARLDELRAELEEAEELCDTGRAERLRAELDLLVSQLSQRFGSRARTRGPAETARKAVTKVLRTQIDKLLETHPALGEHLRDSIRTGVFCSYAPRTPATWEVVFDNPSASSTAGDEG